MSGSVFEPDDFLIFLDPDEPARVEYIRDELHPRLRELGEGLRDALGERVDTELRCQLRSGRWHKTPWGTWVSIVSRQERRRSDPKRPRLVVFIDEREAVAGLGLHVLEHYRGGGITFPLGYTDGMQMYLPTSAMIDEGGYEVVSYYEYGQPAPAAKGMEEIITGGLDRMRDEWIR